jgi:site-specific DNA recombinase
MAQAVQGARRRTAVASVAAPVRVAIYTRRSTVETDDAGLTAVDRQRDAGEAFVRAQAHQNWMTLPERFDDAGFTGANTDRPALKRLLALADARQVDVILVNRLDRLTRSLADFVRLHEYLQERGVHLASIVESIDTGSPAGRMMVSLLAAFGQYERELIAARTREKLSAARRKGRFTGGLLVLGFDRHPNGGRLVPNAGESEIVRQIFRVFLETRSLVGTLEEIARRGWTLKRWVTKTGREYGGGRFDLGTLKRLLTNYIYIGKVKFQGQVYEGEHKGIVPAPVFREAQKVLAGNGSGGSAGRRNIHGALLRGLLYCGSCGRVMSHQWTRKRGRVYRYYVCKRKLTEGYAACPTESLPALAAEGFVADRIRGIGRDHALRAEVFRQALGQIEDERREVRAELSRLERERTRISREVERLVAALASIDGQARAAITEALSKAQDETERVVARIGAIELRAADLAAHRLDETELARALHGFDGVWDALLIPEKERVLRLLIERISYHGAAKQIAITFRPSGITTLASEVERGTAT